MEVTVTDTKRAVAVQLRHLHHLQRSQIWKWWASAAREQHDVEPLE